MSFPNDDVAKNFSSPVEIVLVLHSSVFFAVANQNTAKSRVIVALAMAHGVGKALVVRRSPRCMYSTRYHHTVAQHTQHGVTRTSEDTKY